MFNDTISNRKFRYINKNNIIYLYIYRFKYINISTVKFNKLTLTIFWFKKLNFCETFQTSDVLTL